MARAMKDSGVEWIGEIPEGWSLYKIKSVISKRISGEWGGDISQDGTIIKCYRIADFDTSLLRFKKSNEYTYRSYAKKIVEEKSLFNGAILIEKSGGGVNTPVGRVVLHDTDEPALFSNFMDCLKPAANVVSKWLLYFLHCFHTTGNIRCYIKQTTGIQNLSITDYFANEYIPIPSLEEQQRIADFLDAQTAAIDASIAKTQESIEEYKKLKQAVITQAVTKGIRPGRVMKDSGVEWIGEIPEEWDISTLGRVTREMRNGYVGPTRDLFVEEGERYLQSLHIKDGGIYFEKQPYYVTREWLSSRPTVKAGDILIVQTGDIGQVGLVTEEYAGCGCHALIIATPDEVLISPKFLTYYLMSHTGRELVLAHKTGALLPHLNSGKIKFAFVCVPTDIAEQQEIAAYLDEKCAAIDTLIEKKQAIITELEVYKKSLIYEYVTGKKEVPMASC